jgi:CBS domain-containing protein
MNISDLCTRELVAVPANASVRAAAEAMRANHVGALAVTDPHQPGQVVGILTDRDLVLDLLAEGRSPEAQPIGALCTTELLSVPGAAGVREAIDRMRRHGVRRLFVTGADGAILGLISVDDLLQAVARELGGLAGTVRINIEHEAAPDAQRVHPPRDRGELMYLPRHEP